MESFIYLHVVIWGVGTFRTSHYAFAAFAKRQIAVKPVWQFQAAQMCCFSPLHAESNNAT